MRHTGAIFQAKAPDFASASTGQEPGSQFGDFSAAGRLLRNVRRELCELADLRASESALEVTAGSKPRGATVRDQEDESFDVVTSAFASAFAKDASGSAGELMRVCRKGGRIAVAAWTPDGFVGQLAATVRRYLPADGRANSPVMWGTRGNIDKYFGRGADALGAIDRSYMLRYRSKMAWLDDWRADGGPLAAVFKAVDPDWRDQFAQELMKLVDRFDESNGPNVVVRADYLVGLVHKSTWQPALQ